MPTFDTPGPIDAEIDLFIGNLQINAGDRADTTVEVRPRDPDKNADVWLAEQIQADYADGRLLIKDTSGTGLNRLVRKGVADVTVDLPAGSRIRARTRDAGIRCQGTVGASTLAATTGNIALDRAVGDVELTTSHGWIRAQEIDGDAAVKTSSGAATLGTVTGRLKAKSAHGAISAEHLLDSAEARTAHGSVRIGEVVRGRVELETSYGELDVGIREGTAAWLDAGSKHGGLSNSLEAAETPDTAEETAEVYIRSLYGDIVVRRA
ncbi:DUF4097 family beta strand repeat-containing protein [Streptomonospora litoralis]|uniref:DUF4097 domain-containing protein n=1 Tax=Streptomonospora litoralis TaxID=2498135 RepID=A0A4V0ZK99_9ACTN|nr:DUF4097 family beta strand repeat-containing protein [Streptomonospora litoralis]QBI56242.1 hypothetical protein EKD16_22445 [Streptomonospora litoralis]